MFRQLGVFSSRFDLDAVAHVVGAEDRDPLDVVAHLIDVSLLEIVEGPDGEPMIFMLETIRRFARERLQASEEHDDVRLAHARWYVQVAAEISGLLNGPRQMSALDRMKAVEEDIRAALEWCLASTAAPAGERAECGYALLEPMNSYWYRFGYIAEGRGWHDRAMRLLASDDVPDSAQVVDALHGEGILAVQQLDLTAGSEALERALAMAHRLGDLDREARESNSLGIARREAGDVTRGARPHRAQPVHRPTDRRSPSGGDRAEQRRPHPHGPRRLRRRGRGRTHGHRRGQGAGRPLGGRDQPVQPRGRPAPLGRARARARGPA